MLILCPECNEKVSDKSDVCIYCGYPLTKNKKLYDLEITNINIGNLGSNTSDAQKRQILIKQIQLLQEVLGYSLEESKQIAVENQSRTIAVSLNAEQVCKILPVFYDNDINMYIKDHNTGEPIYGKDIEGYPMGKRPIQDHYYDTPVITRDHLCDVFKPEIIKPAQYQPQPTNVPKCPTCGSTNIKKISNLNRGASVATFGLFSKKINKSFKCNSCGYTW